MSKVSSKPSASGFKHKPVLLRETLEALAIRPDGTYVDCTLGGGGHAEAIAGKLSSGACLIGLDKDDAALKAASARIAELKSDARIILLHRDFRDLRQCLSELGIGAVDGILADLGVSSPQLDQAERGFAYLKDGPLDMRMDRRQKKTAAELVNELTESELAQLFFTYGEERYARSIARGIVKARAAGRIETTMALSDCVISALPAAARREKNPCKRVFQALRIAVNDELAALKELLDTAPDIMNPGGRLCLITFHSLEDRIVKQQFKRWEHPCTCPPDFPVCVCGKEPIGHVPERRGVVATEKERGANPRAHSARLRVFVLEKHRNGAESESHIQR